MKVRYKFINLPVDQSRDAFQETVKRSFEVLNAFKSCVSIQSLQIFDCILIVNNIGFLVLMMH